MRLVINAMAIAPGGGLSVLLGLLEGWRTIGADLDITIVTYRAETIAALRDAGWGERIHAITVTSSRRSAAWQRSRLPALLRELRADVLLTNNFYIPGAPCPQVVHHQTLWSVFARGLWPYARKGLRRLLLTLGARDALRRAEANVFISGYMRACGEALVPGSSPRNRVVYNGLNNRYIEAARQLQAAPAATTVRSATICALQAPTPHKDNDSLIAALAELVRREPSHDWQLRVVGSGGPDGAAWQPWREMAARLGVGDRVQFLGHKPLSEVAVLFRESCCLVYPSLFEGFGMPILEAMAMGCPVVTVRETAMPEVAGDAAILVPPRSPQEIASAVLSLYHDADRRRDLITRGAARALEFPWTRSAAQFVEVFNSVAR
jgi:glycosyltransferase involved in cell wall biosynthesis